MRNKFLLFIFLFLLINCQPDYSGDFDLAYTVFEFEKGYEFLADNAWAYYDTMSNDWDYNLWIEPPCHLGGGFYLWTMKDGIKPEFSPKIVFLETSGSEWNEGDRALGDSLICKAYPFTEKCGGITVNQARIIEKHMTIVYDTVCGKYPVRYPVWADTTWFLANILNRIIPEEHCFDF